MVVEPVQALPDYTPNAWDRKEKNKNGKWVPKRSKELKEELLALKKVASAQALPGRKRSSTAST